MPPLIELAIDSLFTPSIAPGYDYFMLTVLALFGHTNPWIIVAISLPATVAGLWLNRMVGSALRGWMPQKYAASLTQCDAFGLRYGFALMLLYWIPLGCMLTLIAGFVRLPVAVTLFWGTMAALLYHIWVLWG